jgi:hypothetical protein
MSHPTEWLDPRNWRREGRGRTWSFDRPTSSVIDALAATAYAVEDELDLLVCRRTRSRSGASASIFDVRSVADLAFDESCQYFVRSRRLSSTLPDRVELAGVGWPALFAVNGLIVLMHPFPSRTAPGQSRIGVVARVVHDSTGERREHLGYDRIFDALKSRLTRAGH